MVSKQGIRTQAVNFSQVQGMTEIIRGVALRYLYYTKANAKSQQKPPRANARGGKKLKVILFKRARSTQKCMSPLSPLVWVAVQTRIIRNVNRKSLKVYKLGGRMIEHRSFYTQRDVYHGLRLVMKQNFEDSCKL